MRSMTYSDLNKFCLRWRGVLLLLGGLGVLVLVGLALWHVPQWQAEYIKEYPYQLAKLTDEYRRTLAQGIGGFFLFVGLYLGWLRVKAAQDNVRVAEEGQITERFTRAIDQLGQEGDDKMAIRLGGIYALERIAKDSETDHGPIMEVLTAYVREKAPRREEDIPTATEKPPTDLQAILTVLGRRETTGKNRGTDRLDLNYTRLTRANLGEADLGEANLSGADLRGANLSGANLRGANLGEANLSGADLSEANLCKASLYEANLRGADLSETDLSETNLFGASLSEASLYEANLRGAFLSGANLRGADLRAAALRGAFLSGANLSAADLSGASLSGADLRAAENLTAEQVQSAENWHGATLPDHLKPPVPPARPT